jgi:hypothetical protein
VLVGTELTEFQFDRRQIPALVDRRWPSVCGDFSGSQAIGKNRQGFRLPYQRFFCPALSFDGIEYRKGLCWLGLGKNRIEGERFGNGCFSKPQTNIFKWARLA